LRALEKAEKEEISKWMLYWIVLSIFEIFSFWNQYWCFKYFFQNLLLLPKMETIVVFVFEQIKGFGNSIKNLSEKSMRKLMGKSKIEDDQIVQSGSAIGDQQK
jgi:hypothetical protein